MSLWLEGHEAPRAHRGHGGVATAVGARAGRAPARGPRGRRSQPRARMMEIAVIVAIIGGALLFLAAREDGAL